MTPPHIPSPMPTLLDPYTRSPKHQITIKNATNAPFLQHAGAGALSAGQLSYYLSQDLHYTRAYIRFAAGLLSLVHVPATSKTNSKTDTSRHGTAREGEGRKTLESVIDLLVGSLNNIRREQRFFEEVMQDYSLPSTLNLDGDGLVHEGTEGTGLHDVPVEEVMRRYCSFLEGWGVEGVMRVRGGGREGGDGREGGKGEGEDGDGDGEDTWLERLFLGLVVLWGTEWCYYLGWGSARAEAEKDGNKEDMQAENENARRALREKLIPNWTSEEFRVFVEECGKAVDEVGEMLGVQQDAGLKKRAEQVFERVMRLEAEFWEDAETGGTVSAR